VMARARISGRGAGATPNITARALGASVWPAVALLASALVQSATAAAIEHAQHHAGDAAGSQAAALPALVAALLCLAVLTLVGSVCAACGVGVADDGVKFDGPYNNVEPVSEAGDEKTSRKANKHDVDERCYVAGYGQGTIRFYGKHAETGKKKIGVELDQPLGKSNGTVSGHEYFRCMNLHGVLTAPGKVFVAVTGGKATIMRGQRMSPLGVSREGLEGLLEHLQQKGVTISPDMAMEDVAKQVLKPDLSDTALCWADHHHSTGTRSSNGRLWVREATFFVAHQTTDATRVFHKVIKHSMQASDAHFYWVDVFCSRVLYTVVDDDDN